MGISCEGRFCASFLLHSFPSLQADSSEQPVVIAQDFQEYGQVVSSNHKQTNRSSSVPWSTYQLKARDTCLGYCYKHQAEFLLGVCFPVQSYQISTPPVCTGLCHGSLHHMKWRDSSHSIYESLFTFLFEADFLSCVSSSPCLLSPEL